MTTQAGLFGDDDEHDPGGKVSFPLMPGVKGGAIWAGKRQEFRPMLWRSWGPVGSPFVAWIGMNPSMAKADIDDPTVRREQEFTMHMGFQSYRKFNVSDYRATDPDAFKDERVPLMSDENVSWILDSCAGAKIVIACWGKPPLRLRTPAHEITCKLLEAGISLKCLGYTNEGYPRHPLYVKGGTKLLPFPKPDGAPT